MDLVWFGSVWPDLSRFLYLDWLRRATNLANECVHVNPLICFVPPPSLPVSVSVSVFIELESDQRNLNVMIVYRNFESTLYIIIIQFSLSSIRRLNDFIIDNFEKLSLPKCILLSISASGLLTLFCLSLYRSPAENPTQHN